MERNHTWGAAPANILSRYVLGIRPLIPGMDSVSIIPNSGCLEYVRGKVPTRYGPVRAEYDAAGVHAFG